MQNIMLLGIYRTFLSEGVTKLSKNALEYWQYAALFNMIRPIELGSYSGMDIILADDHVIFREGLNLLLSNQADINVVGQFSDIKNLKNQVQQCQPNLIILDYYLLEGDSLAAIGYFKSRYPDIKIIMLTGSQNPAILTKLVASKADAVTLKEGSAAQMLDTISRVCEGERVVSEFVISLLDALPSNLTNREFQVLTQIAKSLNNKEIAEVLSISPKTVDKHRENIMKKLQVNSAVQLINTAKEIGLLE